MSELSQPAARLVPNSFEFDKLRRDKSVVAAFVERHVSGSGTQARCLAGDSREDATVL